MFDLVRALNTSIDAGELGRPTPPPCAPPSTLRRVLGVLSLRRAEDERPPVPVEEIEQLIGARRAARPAAISPKPIASARTSRRAASSSKTRPTDAVEDGK